MKETLGDRIKENYENRTRYLLPRRTNVIIRIDGKAFHSYTRGLNRPIDEGLTEDMNLTAKFLCENIQGAKFGFVQSDEISILMTDYDDIQTDAWFDYNLQKMCSISASLTTAKFNQLRLSRLKNGVFANEIKEHPKLAMFDSRVFVIPDFEEVVNYFVWRQQDATRNSISMAAQSMFSHRQLQGKSSNQMQDMMMTEKGVNWNDYPIGFKRGRAIVKVKEQSDLVNQLKACQEAKRECIVKRQYEEAVKQREMERNLLLQLEKDPDAKITRKHWEIVDPPVFTQDRKFILENFVTLVELIG